MIGDLGWQELLIILVIVALLFGAGRVADMGGALGRGIREFRQAAKSDDEPAKNVSQTTLPAAEQGTALAALEQLHKDGILTDAEFETKRDALTSTHS